VGDRRRRLRPGGSPFSRFVLIWSKPVTSFLPQGSCCFVISLAFLGDSLDPVAS